MLTQRVGQVFNAVYIVYIKYEIILWVYYEVIKYGQGDQIK